MTHVLDASALIALLLQEPGVEIVAAASDGACIGVINLAEVATKVAETGYGVARLRMLLGVTAIEVITADDDLAFRIGELRTATRHLGLSLGDRACLALGMARGLPVLTADRSWSQLDLGLDIRVIR